MTAQRVTNLDDVSDSDSDRQNRAAPGDSNVGFSPTRNGPLFGRSSGLGVVGLVGKHSISDYAEVVTAAGSGNIEAVGFIFGSFS
jgi:hypothetical protein